MGSWQKLTFGKVVDGGALQEGGAGFPLGQVNPHLGISLGSNPGFKSCMTLDMLLQLPVHS